MERIDILKMITVAALFLTLVPKTESLVAEGPGVPGPLCASQFALVNYACGRLPFSPRPPDDNDDDNHEHGHGNRHGHGHRHRHRHHHREVTPEEENCCRWAKDVDTQCVCELLVHLPPFLVKPAHEYTLNIGDECDVTYSCGSPI